MGCLNGTPDSNDKIKGTKIQIGQMNLTVQQKIASGAYGDIWKCKDSKSSQLYAAKQLNLQTKQLKQMFEKQVNWLQKLATTNGIIKYVGNKVINSDKKHGVTPIGVIVTQFYEISLYDELKNRKFSVQQIIQILKQILNALKGIHKLGCLHLDLKLENILCQRLYHICDFGSCLQGPINLQLMQKRQKSELKQFIQSNSTLIYRSPEMIQLNKVPLNQKSDIWMLGCITYLLLYRKHPFEGQGQLSIMTAAVDYTLSPQVLQNQKKSQNKIGSVIQCIKKMLQVKLEDRYNETQLLQILFKA